MSDEKFPEMKTEAQESTPTPPAVNIQNSSKIIEPKPGEITKSLRIDRWKNRRKMAWISLYGILGSVVSLIIFGGIGFISTETITAITPIVQFFIATLGGIIGAYIGFATIQYGTEDKYRGNK